MDIEEGWEVVNDIQVTEVLEIRLTLWVGISAAQKLVERVIDVVVFLPMLGKPRRKG